MVVWVHCAAILLLRCTGTSIASKWKEKTLLHSEPSPLLSQRDEAPLISATSTCWRSGSKYEAYSPCWVGCANWQAWNERHALVAWLLVSTCSSDRGTKLQTGSSQTHLQFLMASLSPSVKQGQERLTHIPSKFEFLHVKTTNKPKKQYLVVVQYMNIKYCTYGATSTFLTDFGLDLVQLEFIFQYLLLTMGDLWPLPVPHGIVLLS